MIKQTLQEIGKILNISDQEIRSIQNARTEEKLMKLLVHPVLIGILSILTFILGILLGAKHATYSYYAGYPYHQTVGLTTIRGKKKGLLRVVIPVITFIQGYLIGRVFFGVGIKYNVYRRG